jgi:multidrug efflux pump subunit AcrA (membrane-fusion protein)
MSRPRTFAAQVKILLRACPALLVILTAGCHKPPPQGQPIDIKPKVRLLKPEKRTITRQVGQPGFVYAYEQTSLYPKVTGYLEKWNVDIGDRIKKDQVIAEISVPELLAEYRQKKALVTQSDVQIQVAERMVDVAQRYALVASAQVREARANVNKYQAGVERWESEVKRLTTASNEQVINPQILEESRKQLKSDTATRDAAKATAEASAANEEARQADVEKAKADVQAARAKAEVDRADVERLAALVGYTHILAPYDGIVVARNVNTGDYVQPGSGDFSGSSSMAEGMSSRGGPLYVVARTDVVRVFVDVPEIEANYVSQGSKARISFQARHGQEADATVTRTSWSLQPRSRTLRAEIDLPNPDSHLLPGMYAYGRVVIDRPDVWAVPLACVVELGNQEFCYFYGNGKAVRMPVQTGLNDGKWIELLRKQVDDRWKSFSGTEQVIEGDLAQLSDGQAVEVSVSSQP